MITSPRHLEIVQRELRRLHRQAARRTSPDKRTGQRASQRWHRTQARIAALTLSGTAHAFALLKRAFFAGLKHFYPSSSANLERTRIGGRYDVVRA